MILPMLVCAAVTPVELGVVLHAPDAERATLASKVEEVVGYFVGVRLVSGKAPSSRLEIAVASDLEPPLINGTLAEGGVVRERTTVESAPGRVLADVAHAVRVLLESRGHVMHGQLEIETVPSDATVTIVSGAAVLAGRALLRPGRYEVLVTAPGHGDRVEVVRIIAGANRLVTVRLRERRLVSSPWLWAAVGVAALGAAVAVSIALRPEPTFSLCHRREAGACP